ncbi:sce7726 family protein [Oribacterium sp. P6A1]|uniref:sce7726 family protein n=1 Tax=Oribacterium sp. P6A1 TaxID=1410612 RepID=UPI000569356B|nr:sce7726 family protein [Oribacterium sp. P6A1]
MLYDKDIREPLFSFLEETYGKTRIIEEKIMGGSRADIVMVTDDSLYGIEIKSDADRYVRLAGQVKDYNRFFDYNIIAVGSSHAMHVEEHVPDFWGIITIDEVDGRPDFYILRRPKENPHIIYEDKLSLLWRPELQHIVYRNLKHKYDTLSKKEVIKRITDQLDYDSIRKEISTELFERDYNTILDTINKYRVEKENKKPRRKKKAGKNSALVSIGGKVLKKPNLRVSHIVKTRKKKL